MALLAAVEPQAFGITRSGLLVQVYGAEHLSSREVHPVLDCLIWEPGVSEAQRIVALGRRALERGEELCLATVVHVEGSSYRKPGARMLVTSGGGHAGTISGGCLEAEVIRKAWWLTAEGPRIERYSSFADEDGGMPYGLGCGGTVTLLLERGEPVRALLRALERSVSHLESAVIVVALVSGAGMAPGTLAVVHASADSEAEMLYLREDTPAAPVLTAARAVLVARQSTFLTEDLSQGHARLSPGEKDSARLPALRVEYLAPPPALTIFGAGNDAQPLAALAQALGWRVTVADGRAHLARRDRFPQADVVRLLDYKDPALRSVCGIARAGKVLEAPGNGWTPPDAEDLGQLLSGDLVLELAVIITHSYEQDRTLLAALLPRHLQYLGILGPRHRTEQLLEEVAPTLGLTVSQAFARLHSPVGLDLGADDPAGVALSIVAEVQAVLRQRRVKVTRAEPSARGERPLGGGRTATREDPELVADHGD